MQRKLAEWRKIVKPTRIIPLKTTEVKELVDCLSRGHPVDAKFFLEMMVSEAKSHLVELTTSISPSIFVRAFMLNITDRAYRDWIAVQKKM